MNEVIHREEIIIFGASGMGTIAYDILYKEYDIKYFSDNDQKKWNNTYYDKIIIPPQCLNEHKDKKIIIASTYYIEIANQLKKMGLNEIYIFSYSSGSEGKDDKRYSLDKTSDLEAYRNLELDKIFKDKFIGNFNLIYDNEDIEYCNFVEKVSERKKNVLIIAYIFPPLAGSGVQRTLKFVKYLKDYDWNPIVLTVGEDYSSIEKDNSLLNEIPEDVEIYRIDHKYKNSEQLDKDGAQQIFNLLYGVIANEDIAEQYLSKIKEDNYSGRNRIFEPDKYISWINNVLQSINEIIDMNNIDILYTTSGPYSDHIAGYYIKRKYDIPWVADFRDEWSNNHCAKEFYDNNEFRQKLHKYMEQNIVDLADKVITVTPISSQNYRNIFNLPYNKVHTITNGYDEEDFKHLEWNGYINEKFNILFYGSLYFNNYCLDNIIIAVNELIQKELINKDLVKVRIIGKIDLVIQNRLKSVDKYSIIKYIDYKPHLECISEGNKSDLLLLPIGSEDRFIPVYSGKIFEYLRLSKPILAISPKGSVIENLLQETKSGENFEYKDIDGIEKFILKHYNNWLTNGDSFKNDNDKIKQYERRNLTAKLANIFDELIS